LISETQNNHSQRQHLLSIGLPVFNGERYLRFTLDSLLAQTFTDFELLILDNASSDSTLMICQEYAARDPRIKVHRNIENIGAAQNFNLAFSLAKGKYFKWAASDDVLSPEFLEKCIAILENNPEIILCCSKVDRINSAGEVDGFYDYPMRLNDPAPHIRFRDLILTNHFCIAVFGVIRRHPLSQTPLIGKYVGSDRVLLTELGLRGRLYEIPEYLFHRRDHPHASGRMYDKYKRLVWFDPSLKNRINLLYWKVGFEYGRTIFRAPIPNREKIFCLQALSRWFISRRTTLLNDIKAAIIQLFPFSSTMTQMLKKNLEKEINPRGEI
jgi:glycosyltransferase involved in cell wall biosynthesis